MQTSKLVFIVYPGWIDTGYVFSQYVDQVGYLPPALAGIIHINQSWRSQLLHRLYGAFIRNLGYWDRTDCLFDEETDTILQKQFKDVLEIASDSGKQLLFARYPKSVKGEEVLAA
jgi:hypothetical protein